MGRVNVRLALRLWGAVALAVGFLGLSGCAQFWDDILYKPFSFKRVFCKDPDPMLVLHESNNPNDRARALRRLQEPKQHGGSEEDQKLVLGILSTAATSDIHAYSRLCAIAALSHFKDPEAVKILQAAYFAGNKLDSAEQRQEIECAALKSLGDTKNADAVPILVLALKQPPPPPTERQDLAVQLRSRQLRLTAARALGNFNDRRANDALLDVLHEEKDVAMLDGARDALCQATGRKYPVDYSIWDQYLNHPEKAAPPEEKFNIMQVNWVPFLK